MATPSCLRSDVVKWGSGEGGGEGVDVTFAAAFRFSLKVNRWIVNTPQNEVGMQEVNDDSQDDEMKVRYKLTRGGRKITNQRYGNKQANEKETCDTRAQRRGQSGAKNTKEK